MICTGVYMIGTSIMKELDLRDGFAFNNFAVESSYIVSDKKIIAFVLFFLFVKQIKNKENEKILILILISLLQTACEDGCTFYDFLLGGNSCKYENSMETHLKIVGRFKHISITNKL